MSDSILRIGLCQLRTELDQSQTMEKAAAMVRSAAEQGAQIVVLPEMFSTPYASAYFQEALAQGHEALTEAMSGWARDNGVLLVGGSVPEREDGKLYNTSFVFDRDGRQIARHRKVHLFEVDLPGMRFSERRHFTEGREITTFPTPWGSMGVAVCFDLRFPELFRAMANRGARVVFLPAQFNMVTGPAHWEVSLRSRALDNEYFVAACSAARYEGFSYECWGHSLVADPYGKVLCEADETEQLLLCDLDLGRIDEVRAQLPTFLHLRRELYAVAE